MEMRNTVAGMELGEVYGGCWEQFDAIEATNGEAEKKEGEAGQKVHGIDTGYL